MPENEESMEIIAEKPVTGSPSLPKCSLANTDELMNDSITDPAESITPILHQSQISEVHTPKKHKEEADCPIATSILADIANPSASNNAAARVPFQPPVFSEDLLQVPQEVQIYLFGALSSKYLREVIKKFCLSFPFKNRINEVQIVLILACLCD